MADRPMQLVLRHIRKVCATQQAGTLADQELVKRYATQRDEVAFAALVRRHGRMVQNVCQTILHHHDDAEDALQATFLVLARKADSIRKATSVSSWLHGVAYRVALKMRTQRAKIRASEQRVATGLVSCPTDELTWRELRQGLHEELYRLPEHYRSALVLCYLEGMTQEEAAHALGWSATTLKGRLTRGREFLRRRLTCRGLTLWAGLAATVLVPAGMSQALPVAWIVSSVRAANLLALGKAAEGGMRAFVVALAEGVMRAMFLTKLKVGAALALIGGILAAGAGLAVQCVLEEQGPRAVQPDRPKAVATHADSPKPESHNQPESAKALAPTVPSIRAELQEHTGRVDCLSFSPDGKVLASGGLDRTVKLWDVATGKATATLEGHAGPVWAVAFSPDGRTVVAGSGHFDPQRQQYLSGELKIWDVAQRSAKQTHQGHAKVVNALAFSPDGKLLASASDDATVKIWDIADGELKLRQVAYDTAALPPRFRKRPPDAVSSVAFSPDGKLLAWGDNEFAITLWDVATGQEKARV